jgi:hypothetical protein
MDKLQWQKFERNLTLFTPISLIVDGYRLTVEKVESGNRLKFFVYVNGFFKGEWIVTDCEERRRFMFRGKSRLYSKEQVRSAKKILKMDISEFYYYYTPLFPSFRALKLQLINNNKEISFGDNCE